MDVAILVIIILNVAGTAVIAVLTHVKLMELHLVAHSMIVMEMALRVITIMMGVGILAMIQILHVVMEYQHVMMIINLES